MQSVTLHAFLIYYKIKLIFIKKFQIVSFSIFEKSSKLQFFIRNLVILSVLPRARCIRSLWNSYNYELGLADYKYDHKNWHKWHPHDQKRKKNLIFYVFPIASINIGSRDECFRQKLFVKTFSQSRVYLNLKL